MSVNDLMDSEILIPSMFVIFIIIMVFAIPAGLANAKKANEQIYGTNTSSSDNKRIHAKIIALRTTPHPLTPAVLVNKVLFELTDGSRCELAIKDPNVFSTMAEGDYGMLCYHDHQFISFERNVP